MIELTGPKIFAVPYRDRRALKAVRLPDGAIVERLAPEQRRHIPLKAPAYFEADEGHFVGQSGSFLLPSGYPAIVYGGTSVEI